MISELDRLGNRNRVVVSLKSECDTPLSAVDVTNFLQDLASLYYKADILDSIVHHLANGRDFEEIYLLQKSLSKSTEMENGEKVCLKYHFDFMLKNNYFSQLLPTHDELARKLLIMAMKDIDFILKSSNLNRVPIKVWQSTVSTLDRFGISNAISDIHDAITTTTNSEMIEANSVLRTPCDV